MDSILPSLDEYAYDAQKCFLGQLITFWTKPVLSSLHFIFYPLWFIFALIYGMKTDMKLQKQIIYSW